MPPKKVNLIAPSLYQEKLCSLFAENVFHTNEYMYITVNKRDPKRVKEQIYAGKMAEYAVFNFLVDKYERVSEPDIMIYGAEKKSYDADIRVDGNNLHIKSCAYGTKYPNSWLFQPTDKVTTEPNEKDMIAFVMYEGSTNFTGYFVKAIDVLSLYTLPMKEELIKLGKKFIYEEDLLK